MTVEYVLLLFAVFFIGLKVFMTAPREAFKTSGPHLAARVENQIETGQGWTTNGGNRIQWKK